MDINKLSQVVETEEASPEEQAQYEKAYDIAMQSLHGGEVAKNTVARVLNAKTPAEGVAKAVFVLLRRVEVQMKGLEDAVKIQVGEDLVQEILGLMIDSERMSEGEVTDELVSDIVNLIYQQYVEDEEKRGVLDKDKIKADVDEGAEMVGEKPQGYAAMSNQEAQTRGLMNV